MITPQNIRWDAATRTAWIDVQGLAAGQYQLNISSTLQNSAEIRLEQGYVSTFTALLDMTSQVQLEFSNTRADRATGEVSYDVSLTNIGTDDLKGPLTLLLDPGRYFGDSIDSASIGGGDQSDLWIIDLSSALLASGGKVCRRRYDYRANDHRHPGEPVRHPRRHGRPGQIQPGPWRVRRASGKFTAIIKRCRYSPMPIPWMRLRQAKPGPDKSKP